MRKSIIISGLIATLLSACAPMDPIENPPPSEIDRGQCDAAKAEHFIGETASTAMGEQLLKAAHARELRWAPEGAGLTMDFRPDRLTVSLDIDNQIEGMSCG